MEPMATPSPPGVTPGEAFAAALEKIFEENPVYEWPHTAWRRQAIRDAQTGDIRGAVEWLEASSSLPAAAPMDLVLAVAVLLMEDTE